MYCNKKCLLLMQQETFTIQVTTLNSFWKNTCILWARPCINKKIYVFDNLKLPLLRRYSITGWIVKKLLFPFSKIMKNWDLHFRILLVIVFCSGLFPVVFITIWIKGFWYNFFHYGVGLVAWKGWGKDI